MANVAAPNQPTLTALRTEDLNYRLSLVNARFGVNVTIADLDAVVYDVCNLLVVQAEAVVNGNRYRMWRSGDTIHLYRVFADGSQNFVAQLN